MKGYPLMTTARAACGRGVCRGEPRLVLHALPRFQCPRELGELSFPTLWSGGDRKVTD